MSPDRLAVWKIRFVGLLFAFSGCAGLIFEVIWTRQLALVLGSTLQSAALVTGCFLFCLGLGAWLAGRLPSRWQGLRAYAIVELVAAVSGATVTWLLPKTSWLSQSLPESTEALLLARLALAMSLLAVPCLAMGASLPFLCNWLVAQNQQLYLRGLSRLYALNTLGAVCGVWLADWILIRKIGLFQAGLSAAGIDALVGLLALGLARRSSSQPMPEPERAPQKATNWKPLAILFGLGLCGSLVQVLFTRSIIVFQGSDITAFSTCLLVYLSGLSLGGHLASRGVARPQFHLHSWLLAACGAVLISFFSLGWCSRLPYESLAVIWTIGPSAVCLGACFPLASQALLKDQQKSGQIAASSVLANTLGSLWGALLSGFVLIPILGMQYTVLVVTNLLALLALATVPSHSLGRSWASVLMLLCQPLLLFTLPTFYLRDILYPDPSYRFIFWGEDGYGSVALVEQPDYYTGEQTTSLMVDGFNMMGDVIGARRYATAIGALPILLQNKPEEALVICFGLAHTASIVVAFSEIKRVDCVELSPIVIRAVSRLERCANVLRNPKMHLKIGDGRHHLLTTKKTYSLVVAEPPPPSHAGVVNLYTREYYQLCAQRLKSDGWVAQWLPIFQLSRRDTRTIIRAFLEVFPEAYLVDGAFYGQMLLVGSRQPLKVNYRNFVQRARAQEAHLKAAGWDSPEQLLSSIVGGPKFLRAYTENSPALTDDWPILLYDRDFNPDYASLILEPHPREFPIEFANAQEKAEFETAERIQQASHFYFYQDAAARTDSQKVAWRSALEVYERGRQALEAQPQSNYLQTAMLCSDFFLQTRAAACDAKPTSELCLNLARALYLRGQFAAALDRVRQAHTLKPEPFAKAFEILILQQSGQAELAARVLAQESTGLQAHDRDFLTAKGTRP